ncbi:MAG: DUF115 domain-containing protein, partial [Rhodocyclales bacterium]|nr:DUF115 domain-containing protein [Rhodocyclales bacterium]
LHSFHRQFPELRCVLLLRYLLQLRFSFQFAGALYPISWKTKFRGKLSSTRPRKSTASALFDMNIKQTIKSIVPSQHHGAIHKIVNIIFAWVETMFYGALRIDSHTSVRPEQCSTLKMMLRTNRYRLASAGIPVTANEKKLLHLRNLHAGQRAFIIGNGPSLNLCDLSLLKDEITFGVNGIFLNYEKMGFHPTYYVVEDLLVAEDRAEQINSYSGPHIKFFGNYLRYCLNDSSNAVWLNVRVNYEDYEGFPHFSRDAARMVWVGGTVSYLCMQLAYFMGFSTVYLVGFDHSYRIPDDAKLNLGRKEITSASDDPNHFDPNYFGKGYRWHDPMVERMEMAYRRARQNFEADNRTIFNATAGGQLNVFPRIDFHDLLGKEHPARVGNS